MEPILEIKRAFQKIMILSMTPRQIESIAQEVDNRFDLYKLCGMPTHMPIPRQLAAETVIRHFKREDDIIALFLAMIQHENKKLRENVLVIQNKNHFFNVLKKHKWIYNEYLNRFHRDPFYEKEIDFIKSLRTIDLRKKIPHDRIISEINKVSKDLNKKNFNWKITIRLYEMDNSNENLIKKIIELLLISQNLHNHINDLFFCLRELASNASRANYKVVFEKYIAPSIGLDPNINYQKFLEGFKKEYNDFSEELIKLVEDNDIYFNIFMQSTEDSIALWVSNYSNISDIEKKRIQDKLNMNAADLIGLFDDKPDKYAEGAGMGVNLVKEVLTNISHEEEPIKMFFFPDFFKIGFEIKREDLKSS